MYKQPNAFTSLNVGNKSKAISREGLVNDYLTSPIMILGETGYDYAPCVCLDDDNSSCNISFCASSSVVKLKAYWGEATE